MSHLQLVVYQGNLGGAPEMRYTANGKAVTNFSMASTVSWKNANGEKVSQTTWFKVTCWGALAEIVNQYATKGCQVIVTGKLKPDENGRPTIFTNSAGQASASFEITAESVNILSPKERTTEGVATPPSEDDIPF